MFKEEYRKEMQKIIPDSSFLQNLAVKMEQETKNSPREKINIHDKGKKSGHKVLIWSTTAAAAVICIGIGIWWKGRNGFVDTNDNIMKQNAGGMLEQTETSEGIFNGSSWYGNETKPERIFEILVEKMTEDHRLVLSSSKGKNFQNAIELDTEKSTEMIKRLSEGQFIGNLKDTEELLTESPTYYLAEFQDGTVVKFAVYGEKYFFCSEIDGVFVLNE